MRATVRTKDDGGGSQNYRDEIWKMFGKDRKKYASRMVDSDDDWRRTQPRCYKKSSEVRDRHERKICERNSWRSSASAKRRCEDRPPSEAEGVKAGERDRVVTKQCSDIHLANMIHASCCSTRRREGQCFVIVHNHSIQSTGAIRVDKV